MAYLEFIALSYHISQKSQTYCNWVDFLLCLLLEQRLKSKEKKLRVKIKD